MQPGLVSGKTPVYVEGRSPPVLVRHRHNHNLGEQVRSAGREGEDLECPLRLCPPCPVQPSRALLSQRGRTLRCFSAHCRPASEKGEWGRGPLMVVPSHYSSEDYLKPNTAPCSRSKFCAISVGDHASSPSQAGGWADRTAVRRGCLSEGRWGGLLGCKMRRLDMITDVKS